MGSAAVIASLDPALTRFARRLQEEIGACRVLLYGSHARGQANPQSDYDLIIVAPAFREIDRFHRSIGLRQLWYDVGGDAPMDILCMTPEEFEQAQTWSSLVTAVLPESIDLLAPEAQTTA